MGIDVEKRLGARVAAHRRTKRLSQEQLAERVGVNPATISRLERGSTTPSIETLAKIADALRVELHDLFEASTGSSARDAAIEALVVDLKHVERADIELVHGIARLVLGDRGGSGRRRRVGAK